MYRLYVYTYHIHLCECVELQITKNLLSKFSFYKTKKILLDGDFFFIKGIQFKLQEKKLQRYDQIVI